MESGSVVYVDTIEQSMCRLRTEEEDRAVAMCTMMRVLVEAGAQELHTKGFNQVDMGR